ncbi:GntR family transcriptional regulator [Clostridium bowmanii]|uniref:GntR family transcriptional regulator n=1 Tax=Clostridium bowmanii TaxID=132925 RepID=UPI001C0DB2AA|nr:GntR family transcriptional regulator [Clostridium bowmanii]MBU3189666.1 GntR family transcriptional regulator [Clostridium bowmanii]MCA1073489.1 GntR family transcriptional regulator [Clostridium bowmanii]
MKNGIETEIFDKLLYDINVGNYKVNDKLPSENEIADMHHVPRIVARKVYEELEELGYIYTQRGKGRYLNERYYEIELVLFGKESFSTKMKSKGYKLITKNIDFEKIKYSEKIFNKLGVTKDDEVFKIARLRIVEGRSVAIHTSYVSKSVFNDIDKYGNSILSMFEYYKQHGYNSFKSSISVLSISIPSSEERKNLECSKLIPVIILETDCIDTDSKVVLEYTKILYRGDCFKYNLM